MAKERAESQQKISDLQNSLESKVKEYEKELHKENCKNEKAQKSQSKIIMNNSGGTVIYSVKQSNEEEQFEDNEEKEEKQ